MKNQYQYLFGPVPSRRLGRSLGLDLTPYKTCCFDCIFCQLGRTVEKTVIRKEYVPLSDALSEVEGWMKTDGNADYITLSGSGEPTLHSRFGEALEFIGRWAVPSALLTNGALFHLPEVRESAACADVVKISLSAWDQTSFEWVNRPHRQIQFRKVIEGVQAFRKQFQGMLWIEVFIVSGVNSAAKNVAKIAELVKTVSPDKIHLNTVVRPPAEDFAAGLPKDRMKALADLFTPPAGLIPEFNTGAVPGMAANENAILAMLMRRPCTMEQISRTFGMNVNETSKYLGNLMRSNSIRMIHDDRVVYYKAVAGASTSG